MSLRNLAIVCCVLLAMYTTIGAEPIPRPEAENAGQEANANAATDSADDIITDIPLPEETKPGPTLPSDPESEQEKEVKYLVGLLRQAHPATPARQGARVVSMTAKSGQKFNCVIPDPSEDVEKPEPTQEEKIVDYSAKIKQAFGKGCFTRPKDYWTYEVCPFQKVRQFHKEGETVGAEFSLGTYDASSEADLSKAGGLIQKYVGGTDNRQAVVKFVCNEGSADPKPLLTTVSEPRPFHYEFEIKTDIVCGAGKRGDTTFEGLLQPIENECVHHNTGWWTYRFCYGKSVSQLHRETMLVHSTEPVPAGQTPPQPKQETVTVAEFSLGGAKADSSAITLVKGDSTKTTYASQWYVDGTLCDIADKRARKTEVRYSCDPNEGLSIKGIKESATCEYILNVSTRLLCQHKEFAPEVPKVHEIVCSPVEKPTTEGK